MFSPAVDAIAPTVAPAPTGLPVAQATIASSVRREMMNSRGTVAPIYLGAVAGSIEAAAAEALTPAARSKSRSAADQQGRVRKEAGQGDGWRSGVRYRNSQAWQSLAVLPSGSNRCVAPPQLSRRPSSNPAGREGRLPFPRHPPCPIPRHRPPIALHVRWAEERLRECWDWHWGERSARTRAKVRSVWIDFFEWCVRERGLKGNPARPLAAPKKRDVPTETFPPSVVERIIGAQTYPADVVGATLILRYGLRSGGIVAARRRDFDLERRLLTVNTKGGRIYSLPLPDESLWLALGRLDLEAQWEDEHWLLYRSDTRRMRVQLEEAEEIITLGGRQVGYARVTRRRHDRQPTGKLAHLWWYRCLERAGLVTAGTRSGNEHAPRAAHGRDRASTLPP
jgi:integrase